MEEMLQGLLFKWGGQRKPGGSQGMAHADTKRRTFQQRNSSAKALGPVHVVSRSAPVRAEEEEAATKSCRTLRAPARTLAFLLNDLDP